MRTSAKDEGLHGRRLRFAVQVCDMVADPFSVGSWVALSLPSSGQHAIWKSGMAPLTPTWKALSSSDMIPTYSSSVLTAWRAHCRLFRFLTCGGRGRGVQARRVAAWVWGRRAGSDAGQWCWDAYGRVVDQEPGVSLSRTRRDCRAAGPHDRRASMQEDGNTADFGTQ